MTEPDPNRNEKPSRRRGQILGAGVMLVVLLPMVAAYVLFFTGTGIPTNTINKGDLLTPPVPFEDWQPATSTGDSWTLDEQSSRWRLLIPGDGDCGEACQANLYTTRQVHIRLGEKALRVERLYLLDDEALSPATARYIADEHPTLELLKVDGDAMRAALAQTNLAGDPVEQNRYFLMDQQGFVMMGYTSRHSGNDLLKDIKRMLRYSYEE